MVCPRGSVWELQRAEELNLWSVFQPPGVAGIPVRHFPPPGEQAYWSHVVATIPGIQASGRRFQPFNDFSTIQRFNHSNVWKIPSLGSVLTNQLNACRGQQSLKRIQFSGVFGQPLDRVVWPAFLESITFPGAFDRPLDHVTYLSMVTVTALLRRRVVLPRTLEDML